MAKWKKTGLMLGLLFLVLVLVIGSCAPAKPVEKEKLIKIGLHGVFTGALASTGVPCMYGILDSVQRANEQGGVAGVKVKVVWEETGATVPRAIIAHRRFKEAGVVAEVGIITSQSEVLAPSLQKDEIPMLFGGVSTTYLTLTKPVRWVFMACPAGIDEGGLCLYWLKESWTEKRAPRVGVMLYDHTTGWELAKGFEQAAAELGFEFVGREVIPFLGTIDTTVEWLRLAGKKPDLIYFLACGASEVTAIKDSARLEIQKKGITLVHAGYCLDDILPIVKEDAEGWYMMRWCPTTVETDLPGMKAAFEAGKKYRGWEPERIPGMYLVTRIPTQVILEAARRAIEKVGVENLTGPVMRDTWVSIKDFDTGLYLPITISEAKPWITSAQRMYKVRQGKIYPVSEWFQYPGLTKIE